MKKSKRNITHIKDHFRIDDPLYYGLAGTGSQILDSFTDAKEFNSYLIARAIIDKVNNIKKVFTNFDVFSQCKKAADLNEFHARASAHISNRTKRKIAKRGAIFVRENDKYKMFLLRSQESAVFLGKGTKWCISAVNNNAWKTYIKDTLYFVASKVDGRKYAILVNAKPTKTYNIYNIGSPGHDKIAHRSQNSYTVYDDTDTSINPVIFADTHYIQYDYDCPHVPYSEHEICHFYTIEMMWNYFKKDISKVKGILNRKIRALNSAQGIFNISPHTQEEWEVISSIILENNLENTHLADVILFVTNLKSGGIFGSNNTLYEELNNRLIKRVESIDDDSMRTAIGVIINSCGSGVYATDKLPKQVLNIIGRTSTPQQKVELVHRFLKDVVAEWEQDIFSLDNNEETRALLWSYIYNCTGVRNKDFEQKLFDHYDNVSALSKDLIAILRRYCAKYVIEINFDLRTVIEFTKDDIVKPRTASYIQQLEYLDIYDNSSATHQMIKSGELATALSPAQTATPHPVTDQGVAELISHFEKSAATPPPTFSYILQPGTAYH